MEQMFNTSDSASCMITMRSIPLPLKIYLEHYVSVIHVGGYVIPPRQNGGVLENKGNVGHFCAYDACIKLKTRLQDCIFVNTDMATTTTRRLLLPGQYNLNGSGCSGNTFSGEKCIGLD
jgi:hypothetical protein